MPLARIVTKFPEESQPLQEELRARGFDVVTAFPEGPHDDPADVEILLEEMTPAEALARADEIADKEDIPVFITPGSISEGARPIAVIPILPEVEQATLQSAHDYFAVPGAAQTEEEKEFDPVAFEEREEWVQPATVEGTRSLEAAPFEAVPDVDATPVMAREDLVEAEPVSTQALSESVSTLQSEPSPEEETVALAPEVQEMIPELELAMPDMEAWAKQEGPVSDWPIWQAGAVDPTEIYSRAPEQVPAAETAEPVQTVRTIRRNGFASERFFWKTAAWAAMVALSALVLGATVHRFSPVPARFAKGTDSSPTQAAEIAPAQGSLPAVTAASSAVLKRTAAHESRTGKAQRNVSDRSPAESKAKTARHPARNSQAEDSIVAPDTVVRYGSKPAPKVQAQVKSDGIKRYTDLK